LPMNRHEIPPFSGKIFKWWAFDRSAHTNEATWKTQCLP
jgi:hypothetical protein